MRQLLCSNLSLFEMTQESFLTRTLLTAGAPVEKTGRFGGLSVVSAIWCRCSRLFGPYSSGYRLVYSRSESSYLWWNALMRRP